MSKDVVVIIPARGGSKRIPGKNIRDFNGRPIISWPISASLAMKTSTRVVVSTDSDEIAKVTRSYGAEVPFSRPKELAGDTIGTAPVIRNAIETLGLDSDQWVFCVYPTATMGTRYLDDALSKARLEQLSDFFTISVGRHRSPLERGLAERKDGLLHLLNPEALLLRTQDCPQRYFDAGKFYLATAEKWLQQETMMSEPFVPYYLPDWATVDIDEPPDWEVAEALHRSFGTIAT